MSVSIFLLILLAAFIHATWNSVVKSSDNKYFATGALAFVTSLILFFFLPFVPFPYNGALPYFIASVVLQIIYYILLAKTYKIADIGLSYPLMRGTAPLFVSLFSYFIWGESITGLGWVSILCIVLGILWLGFSSIKNATLPAILLSLTNATIIAIYTIIDALGVRASGSALSYSVWLFFISTLIVAIWVLFWDRHAFMPYLKRNWKSGMVAGIGSSLSYGIILWCMLHAPIYMVSALRETSIFFVIIIAIFFLKEKTSITRIISAILILLGAMLLKVS